MPNSPANVPYGALSVPYGGKTRGNESRAPARACEGAPRYTLGPTPHSIGKYRGFAAESAQKCHMGPIFGGLAADC